MKYVWKVIMTNGNEYYVISKTNDAEEFVNNIFESSAQRTISVWQLYEPEDELNAVILNSQHISEILFKGEVDL